MKRFALLSFLLPLALSAALPHAIDDFATTPEETPVTIDVLANDFDLDTIVDPNQNQNNNNTQNPNTPLITDPNDPNYDPNDPRLPQNQNNQNNNNQNTQVLETLSIISYTQPTDGYVVQNGNSLIYTPPADFNGTVNFRYSITDGSGHFDYAHVTVTVIPVDDPVTAVTDTFVVVEDGPVQTWNVLANDINPDDDQLFITNFSPTTGGRLQLNVDFSFSYTVNPDFSGNDSFTYTVTDGRGNISTATVNIIVIAINDAPTTSGLEDATANSSDPNLVIDLSEVFDDAEDGPNGVDLSFTVLQGPTANCANSDPDVFDSVSINGALGVRGTPASGGARIHNGTESAPGAWPWMVALVQAGAQNAADGQFCGGTLIAPDWVLTAAHCVEGETPGNVDVVIGRHDLTSTGGERIRAAQFIIHPDYDNNSLDSDIALIRLSRPSTAPVIRPVNASETNLFAPGVSATIAGWGTRFEGDSTGSDVILQINLPIVANTIANQAPQVGPFTSTMIAAGVDGGTQLPCPGDSGGPLMVPDGRGNFVQAGIVSFISPIGCIDPNTYSGYVRVATFYDWIVQNVGTLGDDDSGGGILPARSLVLDFKPHTAGCATIVVEATDSEGLSVSTTFTITISDENAPVVAIPDTFVVAEDTTAASLNVLANDTDTDGDTLSVIAFTATANGTLSKNADDSFAYTPAANHSGSDSFTYTVSDGHGATDVGTVSLIISPVNDAPTGSIADFAVDADDPDTLLDLFAAFDDIDNTDDQLSFALVGNSNPDLFDALTFEGTPLQLFRLNYDETIDDGVYSATLIIRATDPAGASVDVSFTVTVTQANAAPVAIADFELTDEDTPVIFDPLANDSDPDGDSFRIVALTQPQNGLATVVNGQLRYSPDADFNGNDSFTYTIADERGLPSAPATVSILVLLENDAPIAIADLVFATEDTPIVINPLANDIDPDAGDRLTLVSVLSDNYNLANNTFTPIPDFNGTLVINYIVRDRQGLTDTGVILLVIAPVNDPPEPLADFATTSEDVPVTIDVLANDTDPDGDTLLLFSTSDSDAAIVNGDIEYTPDPDFAGTVLISYNVRDGRGGSANATVLINVVAEDDAPIIIDDAYTTNEDTPIVLDLLANDSDPEGATLTITDIGSARVSGSTYTPAANFAGIDSFSYSISDGENTATGLVSITVLAVNDVPEAPAQFAIVTSEDLPVTIDLLGPITDPDGDTVTVARIIAGTTQGTLSPLINGRITYSPRFNFHGTDSLTFDAIDGQGGSTPVTVSITVTPADDVPQANPDAYSTTVNTTLAASTVLANDTDLDSTTLTASLALGPASGTLTLAADGTFTYVPLADFAGTDSFTYRVSADQADSPPATVTIRVTLIPTNPPVATPDAFTTPEDSSLADSVLANDSDADGDTLTATLLTQPANGDLTFNADGSFVYTPDANFAGNDSFSYEVTDGSSTDQAVASITVTPVNDPPEAPAQFIVHTLEDTPLPISLIGPINDPDNDPVTVARIIAGPSNGTLQLPGLYIPDSEFSGSDSFTYAVADGQGGLTNVTVSINVTEVNDPPTANPDSYSTTTNTTLTASSVLANDFDIDTPTLTAAFVTGPANGTLTLAASGAFTYVPLADFAGVDSFTYRADGGSTDSAPATVTITVSAAPTNAPVATADFASTPEDTPIAINLLANDTDADGDTLSLVSVSTPRYAGGTYTPAPDFNGIDTFTYIVSDGTRTDVGTVTVTVTAVNDAPVGPAQFAVETPEDTPVAIDLLSRVTDVDGDTLTLAQFTDLPDNGILAGGNYIPDAEFSGTDAFSYSVIDGKGGAVTVTVAINVTPVNDPPTANDDAYSTAVNTTLTAGSVLANDFDPDTASLTAAFVTGPANGTLTLAASGAFTYVPLTDFQGIDSFTYRADGGTTDSAPATVRITVALAPSSPPVAGADFASTPEDTPIAIDLLANDTDADGDTLSLVSVSTQAYSGGTYTPAPDFNGIDTFTYIVSDGSRTDVGTVTVTVNAVNDAPVAPAQFAVETPEDTPVAIDLLSRVTDVDGDTLTLAQFTDLPDNGIFAGGNYIPDAEFAGADSFSYSVIDGNGGAVTVTVSVNVTEVNDPPTANDDAYSTTVNTTLTASTVLANDFDPDTASLTAAFVTGPANGTLTLAASGAFTYVPLTDFQGVDSFTYRADGGTTSSTPATVRITVALAPSSPPVATADFASTAEDTPVAINLLANDTDADGDTLSLVSVSTQAYSGGTYTPAADFNGVDTFTYIVSDGSNTDVGTVTVTVAAVNDAPTAPAQFVVETLEDTPVSIDLLGPISDIDGDTLVLSQINSSPSNGTFANGVYTPDAEFSGADSLTYSVIDGNGGLTSITVTINVTAVNDPPVANPDAYSTTVNTTLTASTVLANDFDIDTGSLTADFVTGPANGTLTLAASGAFTYVPLTDFEGVDSFTYRADGGTTDSTPATVTITVSAAPTNAPVAVADFATTNEDTPVTIDLTGNDTDADGDTLSLVSVSTQAYTGGSYTPAPDFNGVDTFTYVVSDGTRTAIGTVTVTVTAVNDDPVGPAQFIVETLEDTPVTINLLAPVSDVDGDTLTVAQITASPSNGTFANGVYTPDAEFAGADSLTYSVIDGKGGSINITVTINVTAVNDPPVANPDAYSTTVNTTLTASTVLANDFDIDTSSLTAGFVTGPANGTLTLAASGAFTYVPLTDFVGVDSFTYRADGGTTNSAPATVTITVSAAPTNAPVAVADFATTAEDTPVAIDLLANDTDADGDTLSLVSVSTQAYAGGSYTPAPDFNGLDTFTYVVSDGARTTVGTVTVTVTPVNDAPSAAAQFTLITAEDIPLPVNLLAPLSDIDGDPVTVARIIAGPSNGTFAFPGLYRPDSEFSGTDQIVYEAIDGKGGVTQVTLTINVTAVNDPPVANPDAYSITVNTTLTASSVLANDFDIDTPTLTAAFVTGPANGTLTLAASGAFTYVPLTDFVGVDSFTYRADGGSTDSTPATVTITVSAAPTNAPVAVADFASTAEDTPVAINLLANDTDADGDTLSLVSVSTTRYAGGSYTPAANFNGSDTFTYVVSDGTRSDVGTVTVIITAVNDVPVAPTQLVRETAEDTALVINFTAGFTDVDGDTLAVSAFTALPTNGTLTGNTYRPAANFAGADSIGFTVVDGNGGSTPATLTINVTAVNDAPQPNDDSYTVAFGKRLTVDAAGGLLANDADIDSASLSALLITPPAGGTLMLLPTGAFTYVPLAAFVGKDSFTYRVSDGDANSAAATVDMEVAVLAGSGDFNSDLAVNQADLDLFLPHFGESLGDAGYDDQFDLIDNDTIDVNDLSFLVGLITNNSRGLADFLDGLDDAMAAIKLVGPTGPVQVGETFHVEVWLEDLSLTAAGLRGGAFDLIFDGDLVNMIADSLATTLQPPFNDIFAGGLSLDSLLQALSGFTLQDGLGVNGPVHFATIPFVAQEAGTLTLSANPGDWHLVMAPPVGQLDPANVEFGDDLVIEIVNSLIELSSDYIELPLNAPALDLLNGVFAHGPLIVSGSVNRRAPGIYEIAYTTADGTTVTRTYEITRNWELPLTLGERILTIGMNENAGAARAAIDLVGQIRELRNVADQASWTVSVTAFEGDTLRWSGDLLPAGTLMVENLATGQVINMAAVESLALIPGTQDLVITYHAGVETFDLTLEPGWNAVSLPFAPLDPNVDAIFGAAKRGPIWTWDGVDMVSVAEIHPGRAYWIENTADSAITVRTQGVPVTDLSLRLRTGWNFIGLPAGTRFDTASFPADADIDIFAWDGYSYRRVNGPLTPGVGYWVMSSRAVVLPPR